MDRCVRAVYVWPNTKQDFDEAINHYLFEHGFGLKIVLQAQASFRISEQFGVFVGEYIRSKVVLC